MSNESISCFSDFMHRVMQLEEMHSSSCKFVLGYQQELEKLRRAPLDESSCVVKDILKGISSSRVTRYKEAGCCHVQSDQQSLVKLNWVFENLKDHISRAQRLMEELEKLVTQAVALMDLDLETVSAKRMGSLHSEEYEEHGKQVLLQESNEVSWQASDYAILMSSLLGMMKKDLQMQELVVSDLSLTTESECLQTYVQMWSLRPYVEERMLKQALCLHK